jgi:hypothetical protein
MSLQMRHLTSLHQSWKIFFLTIRRSSYFLFRWLFSVVFWRFCELISLSFQFLNSSQEFFRSFSSSLCLIFIQSNEVLRSNNNIRWMSAFNHTNTIDSRSCDSKISLISFDQSSRHSTIFFAMLQMLHELLSLWLTFVRFKDDFEILLEDFLLTSKIFSDSSHDWELSFFRTQMTNSSCVTRSKNRTHIDRSAHQTNSIVSSSHKSSFSSTVINSFVDVYKLSANLCICESFRVFELDSSTRDVFSKLIILINRFLISEINKIESINWRQYKNIQIL